MESNDREFVWYQKYRPSKIDDCILPADIKKVFKEYAAKGNIPSLLLPGTAGVGKTTIALALCNELGADYMLINGSEESGIDTLRTKLMGFATTVSLTDAKKVIIIDEADGLNPNSFQPALRAVMESVSSNCSFILTCNQKAKIIEPIHSRCTTINFKVAAADKPKIAMQFHKRVVEILKAEGVKFDQKVVAELVTKYFPDFRRTLNELQSYSVSGEIDAGILVNLGDDSYKELVDNVKKKAFNEVRKWVGKNSDVDTTALFRMFYDKSVDLLVPQSIPQLILILADYQYKAAFVADPEINVMAAMTEIMSSVEFKQ